MSTEENKAVVRRFNEEVYNRGNLDAADELVAPAFLAYDFSTGEEASIEVYKRSMAEMQATSSDLHFSIEEQIAEGDKVVTRTIGRGTLDRGDRMPNSFTSLSGEGEVCAKPRPTIHCPSTKKGTQVEA
jgi:hypothetical protein